MIVRIDGPAPGAVTLEGPDDFTRFHVEVRGLAAWEEADAALGTAHVGHVADRECGFVSVDGLKRLAGPRADAAWSAELEKMLAYAKKKGWWDEASQSIGAHLEWK
jgi:hypothetical protein